MKRTTGQATILAYTGVILLVLAYYPGFQSSLESNRLLHAGWHLMLFLGAACLVYGLETLRGYARRYRRITHG